MTATSATDRVAVDRTELRTRFALRLSTLYGNEVPAYKTLVRTSQEVNQRALSARGRAAERLGSIDRVTAERHGAIRVGSPRELAQVARVFEALGMYPCGFYDLRDARPRPVPVISTAFRPLDKDELAANPFRVFTSMLVPEDRRFFDSDLEKRLKNFIDARQLFSQPLLDLADRARELDGLNSDDAEHFLNLATASFAISPDPVDRSWYLELERISSVAADIGGVSSTHINHLTPRVLDIDDLYQSMQAQGIEMIDQIQGPPRWDGPPVLLRQTSFRALAEPRNFREPDGTVSQGDLRVRFGEVEARGIALTHAGRDLYERLMVDVERCVAEDPTESRQSVGARVWKASMPSSEEELCAQGLAFFTFTLANETGSGRFSESQVETIRRGEPAELINEGLILPSPIVYEDFLPRSAAGIFASNLSGDGETADQHEGAERDLGFMSDVVGNDIPVPEDVYAAESDASLREALGVLRMRAGI